MTITDSEREKLRRIEREKYSVWYYENEYWKEDNPKAKNDRYQYDDSSHSERFGFLGDLISKNFSFRTFLDVGCGMGHLLRNFLNKGYNGKGVEVSKDALRHYMQDLVDRNIVIFAGAENLPFEDNSFDTVICLDVMEHLPTFDIDKAISELIRVSKRYLILTINLDNPYVYHPSMLSREEWERRFLIGNRVRHLTELQKKIEYECKQKHPEYDFFIFEKVHD